MDTCKLLLDFELTDHRLEYVVILDEAWLSLRDCNVARPICFVKPGAQVKWIAQKGDHWYRKVMAVAVLTGRGPGPLFFVPPKSKANADFYCEHVLRPLVEEHLPKIYGADLCNVWLHHDRATAHTAGVTRELMDEFTLKYGIRFIMKHEIPTKAPDCSPLDFYGFGNLKRVLASKPIARMEDLERAARQEWA